MRPWMWLRQRWWAMAAIAGLLLGAAIGLFVPIRAAKVTAGTGVDFTLPPKSILQRADDQVFEAVRGGRFWAVPQQQRSVRTPTVNWQLLGVMRPPRAGALVQASGGGPGVASNRQVRVGGLLPDGAVLRSVSADAITFEKDGCLQRKRLYSTAVEPLRGCGNDAASAQPSAGAPPAPPASATSPRPSPPPGSASQ